MSTPEDENGRSLQPGGSGAAPLLWLLGASIGMYVGALVTGCYGMASLIGAQIGALLLLLWWKRRPR